TKYGKITRVPDRYTIEAEYIYGSPYHIKNNKLMSNLIVPINNINKCEINAATRLHENKVVIIYNKGIMSFKRFGMPEVASNGYRVRFHTPTVPVFPVIAG
ncbi:15837_t:CDS:2, partial [Cetraspora pellucida]